MNIFIEWSSSPHNAGACVFMNDGRVTFTLSHPSEKKQSFVVYKAPCIVIYLGVVALVTWYRKRYGLTLEEALSHGLIHELSHVGDHSSWSADDHSTWNEFLTQEVISLYRDKPKGSGTDE